MEFGTSLRVHSLPVSGMQRVGETGVAQDGASEGATPAPTTEHEDDNSLGYTVSAPHPTPPTLTHHPPLPHISSSSVMHGGIP
ncbi:hypothetical protein PAMA_020288 [Pampus argenteus]